jgi:peptidoglycan/xylan/chitin deacetylase (PgdA/CDA1 family)
MKKYLFLTIGIISATIFFSFFYLPTINALEKSIVWYKENTFSKNAIIWSGDTNKKIVALTFDDGPDPRYTPSILKILKNFNVKATFFVVGKNVRKFPSLLIEEKRAGHFIGNHTYDHPDLTLIDNKHIRNEIITDEKLIEKIAHVKTHYFRPPFNHLSEKAFSITTKLGYSTILWSTVLNDSNNLSPTDIAATLVNRIRSGSIILCHDGRRDHTKTVEALPYILKQLRKKGFRFVTIDKLPLIGQKS